MSEETKWYRFRQNNSGGTFQPPAIVVNIEARSAYEANARAIFLGICFDGCAQGVDCDCCGDRWYPANEADAESSEPTEEVHYINWATDDVPAAVNLALGVSEPTPIPFRKKPYD